MALNAITLNELILKLKKFQEFQDQDGLTGAHADLGEKLKIQKLTADLKSGKYV